MKKLQIIEITCALLLLLTAAGCVEGSKGDEAGNPITIIDNADDETEEPGISIEKIDTYEKLEILDWMDSDRVIVSKENEALGKMTLEELSDSYPRSLYLYNLNTEEYKLLKEERELNLGGAKLSPDKKNLVYDGYSLGDPSYYVLNLESLKSFGIPAALGASWVDKDTVIVEGYWEGAYYASTDGKITSLKELEQKPVAIVEEIKDRVYYNASYDSTLMALDPSTNEIVSLNLLNVYGLYPSPDENQMLALQRKGSKQFLLLCNSDGSNAKTIAEGLELGGVSWSPDQRMIAYSMKGDGSGAAVSGLYLYDMLTGKSTQIVVDIWNAATCWSPSGEELAYTQWDGKQYNSSIVYLDYSLQK